MSSAAMIHARDEQRSSSTMIDLLIVLLALIFVSFLLTMALFLARTIRRRRSLDRNSLPTHEKNHRRSRTQHLGLIDHRKLSTLYSVYDEKKSSTFPQTPSPTESVPEIRLTFPDEHDETGRRKSGRVVIVRVGESGIGLEPLRDEEQLPAYEEAGGRFDSIDMDRIGGLREK